MPALPVSQLSSPLPVPLIACARQREIFDIGLERVGDRRQDRVDAAIDALDDDVADVVRNAQVSLPGAGRTVGARPPSGVVRRVAGDPVGERVAGHGSAPDNGSGFSTLSASVQEIDARTGRRLHLGDLDRPVATSINDVDVSPAPAAIVSAPRPPSMTSFRAVARGWPGTVTVVEMTSSPAVEPRLVAPTPILKCTSALPTSARTFHSTL